MNTNPFLTFGGGGCNPDSRRKAGTISSKKPRQSTTNPTALVIRGLTAGGDAVEGVKARPVGRIECAQRSPEKPSLMLFILLGVILLYFGAEGLVRGSASLAARVGISPLIAGLTVVAFGTSAPELSVSVSSALTGRPDIALGNVIGSNIFNIAVILGLAAIIRPLQIHLSVIRRDIPVMIGALLVAFLLIVSGGVSRSSGIGLLVILSLYLLFTIRSAKKVQANEVDEFLEVSTIMSKSWVIDGGVLLAGLGTLLVGSRLFVDGATSLAKSLGVSDAIIGLTVVAAGTSLPELATSVVAAFRKQSDIAIGNVVGSNIFNVFCILGVTAVVAPISTSEIGIRDGLIMLVLGVLLLPFALTGRQFSRGEGAVLLGSYVVYLFFLWPAPK